MNEGNVIARTWKIRKKLGCGSYGTVYAARRISDGAPVAIKTEKISQNRNLLETEYEFYTWIYNSPPHVDVNGIPRAYYFGLHFHHNILVMDRLGPSLFDLSVKYGNFSMKSVFMIGLQALRRLELIHSKSILHHDIKPDNMLMGSRNKETLHLVDFGLAEYFRNRTTKVHTPFKTGQRTPVSLDFGPVNGHKGYNLSRRDDLESLGYVLVYLRRGTLPWMNIQCTSRERGSIVSSRKISTSIHELCRGLPDEMGAYFFYIRELQFDEAPNYSLMRQIFREGLLNIGTSEDFIFEWSERQGVRRSPSTRRR